MNAHQFTKQTLFKMLVMHKDPISSDSIICCSW